MKNKTKENKLKKPSLKEEYLRFFRSPGVAKKDQSESDQLLVQPSAYKNIQSFVTYSAYEDPI